MEFTPKRKLSSADIMGGDVRVLWRQAKKADPSLVKIELYKITGISSMWDEVPSPYGETQRLIGDFIAVNLKTGEVFRSNRCFLPGIMKDSIVAAINSAAKGDAVQFAFLVSVTDDSDNVKNAVGYVYTFETLIEMKESNQMAELAKRIGVDTAPQLVNQNPAKQLEAPVKGSKK